MAPAPAILVAAALLAAGAPAGAGDALLAADTAFDTALARREGPAFFSMVAEDAVVAGSTLLVGRDAVRERWSRYLEPGGPTLRWKPTDAGIAGSGDVGWTMGDARYDWKEKGASRDGLRYVTVWRKGAGGRWEAVLDASLEPAPPGPSARTTLRTVESRDGSVTAAIGTYSRGEGAGVTTGIFLTVRQRWAGVWRTVVDSEIPSQPAR